MQEEEKLYAAKLAEIMDQHSVSFLSQKCCVYFEFYQVTYAQLHGKVVILVLIY